MRQCLSLTLLLLLVTGCGSGSNQAQFAPIQPDPPTATPIIIAMETTPTSVVSEWVAITPYIHETNRFSINRPDSWWSVDQPDGVLFVEPGDEAGYSIFFNDVGRVYNQDELRQYMLTFLVENLVSDPKGFSLIAEERHDDGSLTLQFKSNDPTLGAAINEMRVVQFDTIVYLLLLSASETQWDVSQEKLTELVNSFSPVDTTPSVTPTPEPPAWVLVGPLDAKFGFMYPDNWTIEGQDKTAVSVAMPDTEIRFSATHYDWSRNDPQAAENAALLYINTLKESYPSLQHQPLERYPLFTTDGVTLDFVYETEDNTIINGAVITALNDDQIYQITFTAPLTEYGGSLAWFNPMYKSFKILDTSGIIILEE